MGPWIRLKRETPSRRRHYGEPLFSAHYGADDFGRRAKRAIWTEMLDKIADMYEREVESQVLTMTSMLEPVMILFMGVTVGFIVVSMLLPIFDLNQMIR